MTNGFGLNHDKSLQIYFFCVKGQAKNDFLKDVKSTVSGYPVLMHILSQVTDNCPSLIGRKRE